MVCSLAFAQPAPNKAKARDAFRLASQSYDLGEYRDALTKFKEAYRYYEEPSFLYNIGQCHRQLGERQEAVRFFKTYLIKVPNASNRPDVEQMIARLEADLATEEPTRHAAMPPPMNGEPQPGGAAAAVESKPATMPAVVAQSKSVERRPLYKKWWLWTAVGVVAVGAAVGVTLAFTLPSTPTATTTFGTTHPF
jgi:tetratricopeptide (TPR) repeat protein